MLTPSYNYGRFIEDAILSVRGQQGLAVEHIVQDASSTDDTVEVLERFGDVLNWRSERDEGQSDALNRALGRAEGRWIGWLNADEFYLPGALAHLVRVGEATGADVVYGESVTVDEGGRLMRLLAQHRFNARVLKEFGCYISSSATIFRRSALGASPWEVGVRRIMDWDLYMKLAGRGSRFAFTPYPVGAFRIHGDQVTAAPHDVFQEENAVVRSRHGRPSDPVERWRASRWGRAMHRIYKLRDGGYVRQSRCRAVQGLDLRWFRGDAGRHACERLLGAFYRGSRSSRRDILA